MWVIGLPFSTPCKYSEKINHPYYYSGIYRVLPYGISQVKCEVKFTMVYQQLQGFAFFCFVTRTVYCQKGFFVAIRS